jgi:hypothetical protein
MFICKMNQDVKYVQFKGSPIELINGYKYNNEALVAMYPSYFVKAEEKASAVTKEAERLDEIVPKVEEIVAVVASEVEQSEPKKRGRKPKQDSQEVLVDDSSDVSADVTIETEDEKA